MLRKSFVLTKFRCRYYSKPPKPAKCLDEFFCSPEEVPHITIIRPVKGLEPGLYECLASTFRQTYPRRRLAIFFCVESRRDLSYPVLEHLLRDFPDFGARILVEEEDPELISGNISLGPNPKIRNMSRAYREAQGDIVWIIDCNIWIAKGVAGRMVDTLCGLRSGGVKNKFVHQLPLVVDIGPQSPETRKLLGTEAANLYAASTSTEASTTQSRHGHESFIDAALGRGGGRLEELFMSSSHAKFYTAINTVLIAPCIVGKSTMFRRSHLNYLTSRLSDDPKRSPGIDYFSDNICEDHLIGDLLWKNNVPEEDNGERLGKHAMVFGDLAIQPMSGMSVKEYVSRRVRWLRVRKFTVVAATLVEHGTESIACSLYGAFALTTVPWFSERMNIPPTWTTFGLFVMFSVSLWCLVDWTLYIKLHSASSIEVDGNTPDFALPPANYRASRGRLARRPFSEWLMAWCCREILAFPVWSWAVFGGVTVTWRGKSFKVGLDMKVREIEVKDLGRSVRRRRAS